MTLPTDVSPDHWQDIIDNLHESVITTDTDGIIVSWNRGAERLFGYSDEEVLGRHYEFCHVQNREAAVRDIQAPLVRDGQLQYFGAMVRKSGEIFDGHLRASLITDPDGTITGMVGYTLDVSDQVALRVSEQNLQTMNRLSPVGIYRLNSAGSVLYTSDRWWLIMGRDRKAHSANEWPQWLHPDDKESVLKAWQDTFERDKPYSRECRILLPDGSFRWILGQATPEHDAAGERVGFVVSLTDIDQQKKAEQAVAASEERFSLAIRGAHDGLWDWDLVTGSIYRSPRYLEILGYDAGEILDSTDSRRRLVHPEDWAGVQEFWAEMKNSRDASSEVECRMRRKDGSYVDVITRGFAVRNDEGAAIRIVGVNTDISRRKQAERALADSEERFALAMRGANDGLWDWDMDTDHIYRSPRYLEILGYGSGDVLDAKDRGYALVHPDDRARVIDYFSNLGDGQAASYDIEHRMRRTDGSYVDVVSRGFSVRNDSGKPIRLVGTISDISKRKMAEAELLANRAQAESERRVRLAFENVTVGNIVISATGAIEIFNSAAESIFGYTAEEIIGQNVALLMPEPHRHQHDTYVRAHMASGKKGIAGNGREVMGRRKNGEEFPMHIGIGEMVIGGDTSFVGSVTDLSDVKHLEEQLRQSQRLEAVGQLTGGIAHDFNNLLGIIIGNVELLEEMVGEGTGIKKRIDSILSAIERGASLTRRLLAFSRNQTLSPVSTDSTALIDGLEDMLQRSLGETVVLSIATRSGLGPVKIDPHQFEDALVNLAINARDAMPKGGELKINVAPAHLSEAYAANNEGVTPGNYVVVSVTDTGTGMPPEVQEKAFEPFFTTKDVGKGSGLGLSMVYGFVKQTGGHITIDSRVGRGTMISLYLPRADNKDPERVIEANPTKTTLRG